MSLTTKQLCAYYANLLILQYQNQPAATETILATAAGIVMAQTTVETISFSDVSASGAFVLSFNTNLTASINWNDSASTIQTKIRALPTLGAVTVTGSIASKLLTITFIGVTPVAAIFTVPTNTLLTAGSSAITASVAETDLTVPLAIQQAFNIISGTQTAIGVQLDTVGKYEGIVRTGYGYLNVPITLSDTDFLTMIQFAAIVNNGSSDLAFIVGTFNTFFPGEVYPFDHTDMRMSYLISSSVGSQNLIQLIVNEHLIPKPMGVSLTVIYNPVIDFFGLSTYPNGVNPFNRPLNTYTSYNLTWPWLSYSMFI